MSEPLIEYVPYALSCCVFTGVAMLGVAWLFVKSGSKMINGLNYTPHKPQRKAKIIPFPTDPVRKQ